MAGFLNLKVSGQQHIIKGLKKAAAGLQNPVAVNKAAVIEYEKWVKKNFEAEGGLHEDGRFKNWERLKNSRTGKDAGRKILHGRTGRLRRDWFRSANKQRGILRSAAEYSSKHENGNKATNLPQRKIFPSVTQGNKIVKPVYQAFVKGLVKGIE